MPLETTETTFHLSTATTPCQCDILECPHPGEMDESNQPHIICESDIEIPFVQIITYGFDIITLHELCGGCFKSALERHLPMLMLGSI